MSIEIETEQTQKEEQMTSTVTNNCLVPSRIKRQKTNFEAPEKREKSVTRSKQIDEKTTKRNWTSEALSSDTILPPRQSFATPWPPFTKTAY